MSAHRRPPGAPPTWPEIDVSVHHGRMLPRWSACSDHPLLGVIHGQGISRDAAVRSLLRNLRITRLGAVASVERDGRASRIVPGGPPSA